MGEIYKDIEKNPENNTTEIQVNIGEVIQEPQFEIKFRDDEIKRVRNIIEKNSNRSVLLIGDYGCGKRSVIEGLVEMFKNENSEDDYRIVNFDFLSILKVSNNKKEFEDGLKKIFNGFVTDNERINIININNLGHLVHYNCFDNFGYMFLNEVIYQIEKCGLRIIATTTNKEYSELETHFSKILDYFTKIKLTELTKEQTCEIIENELSILESIYQVKLPENTCKIVCENADSYVKNGVFPKKAEDLLEEVFSFISRKYSNDETLDKMKSELSNLKTELIEAVNSGDYERSNEIDNKIEKKQNSIIDYNLNKDIIDATETDILEAIGFILNIPMTKLSKDKTLFLKNLPDEIKKDIIGQDETIDKIVKNIRRNQLGLRKKAHSAGNYMFIGSTGVGKTAFAKSLAKNLYGSEESILRFDMSEFQQEIDVTKLLGSAPGYVGYKESGLLVKGLAKKPECVCLFDEIEKAHPKVYDVLLQLLDEGSITGSDGVKVDGSKALIIFTSNIGVKSAKELSNPMGFTDNYEELKNKREENIMVKALKKRFSPEFINRLDSICYFNNLSRGVLETILDKEMNEMNKGINNITKKEVELSSEVKNWILDKVELEHNGARPIIRLLEQEIEEGVANLVVNDSEILNNDGNKLFAVLENDKIILK